MSKRNAQKVIRFRPGPQPNCVPSIKTPARVIPWSEVKRRARALKRRSKTRPGRTLEQWCRLLENQMRKDLARKLKGHKP